MSVSLNHLFHSKQIPFQSLKTLYRIQIHSRSEDLVEPMELHLGKQAPITQWKQRNCRTLPKHRHKLSSPAGSRGTAHPYSGNHKLRFKHRCIHCLLCVCTQAVMIFSTLGGFKFSFVQPDRSGATGLTGYPDIKEHQNSTLHKKIALSLNYNQQIENLLNKAFGTHKSPLNPLSLTVATVVRQGTLPWGVTVILKINFTTQKLNPK